MALLLESDSRFIPINFFVPDTQKVMICPSGLSWKSFSSTQSTSRAASMKAVDHFQLKLEILEELCYPFPVDSP